MAIILVVWTRDEYLQSLLECIVKLPISNCIYVPSNFRQTCQINVTWDTACIILDRLNQILFLIGLLMQGTYVEPVL